MKCCLRGRDAWCAVVSGCDRCVGVRSLALGERYLRPLFVQKILCVYELVIRIRLLYQTYLQLRVCYVSLFETHSGWSDKSFVPWNAHVLITRVCVCVCPGEYACVRCQDVGVKLFVCVYVHAGQTWLTSEVYAWSPHPHMLLLLSF